MPAPYTRPRGGRYRGPAIVKFVKFVKFLIVLQIFQPALAALLRRIGGDALHLRLLRLSRFLVRSHLTLGHRDSPPSSLPFLQHHIPDPSPLPALFCLRRPTSNGACDRYAS